MMQRAMDAMAFWLTGWESKNPSWDISRVSLAIRVEERMDRPLKRDDGIEFIDVQEQRALRLSIIGDLLGREPDDPLTSFKPVDGDNPHNMTIVEARALRDFLEKMGYDVLNEVTAEYNARAQRIMNDKASDDAERRGQQAVDEIERFVADINLPIVWEESSD